MKSRIALIHGFAVGLTSPLVRPGFGPTVGMTAFKNEVANGTARVFKWGSFKKVPFHQLINPFFLHSHYLVERAMAFDKKTHLELHKFLSKAQPQVVVCHSMGTVLLNEFLNSFELPASVKAIIFVQSDLPWDISIKTNRQLYHLYCPWDPTLLASSIANRSWRAGLRKLKQAGVKNILMPLFRLPNLHTSSIRDRKLLELASIIK